ncbi:MAG: glycosyltransferase family 9 protein [Betaproteobacteria bacterium]|nr:glycosyltransferase family 9 protein [Betaproteobacteria bacterium]MBI2961664.1 glycosyltransferase family 9 protein [Betaproteobacteria bacterium]
MRRILIVHISRIGDTLLVTPALRAIARAHPEAEITVLAHPKRCEILRLPFIGRVGGITKRSAPWRGRFGIAPYDLAFVYGFDAALVRYALRVAGRVVAFRQGISDIDSRLNPAVAPAPFQSEHSIVQLLRLPGALGIAPAGLRVAYEMTGGEARAARTRLATSGLAGFSPLIGLQVASFPTKAYRDWPVEQFAQLCARISERWSEARYLIFGGSGERRRTEWLAGRLGRRALHLAGRLSLRETAALMSLTDLYVGVDTGPTHLMSAFDIPLVGLYHGHSRSALIAPLEHPCLYAVDHPLAGPACPIEAPMADISVDAVFAQVERALAEHPPRRRH